MNKEFFYDDSITLAQKLLNKYLIREYDNKKIVTKIVETEAYMGETDKAAHAYKNRKREEHSQYFGKEPVRTGTRNKSYSVSRDSKIG